MNTIKLNYCCLPKMKTIIKSPNRHTLNKNRNAFDNAEPRCDCSNKSVCLLPAKCKIKNVIYRATVTSHGDQKTYTGSTGQSFKNDGAVISTRLKYKMLVAYYVETHAENKKLEITYTKRTILK